MANYDLAKHKMTEREFDALLKFTKLQSKATICALREHFVRGEPQTHCARKYGVNEGLLSRRAQRLLQVKLNLKEPVQVLNGIYNTELVSCA